MINNRFSPIVSRVLSAAGWFAGRNVGAAVEEWAQRLCVTGRYRISPAALAALREFGGLSVHQKGPGLECGREPFDIDPLSCEGYEAELARLSVVVAEDSVFPLGQAGGGQAFLVVGSSGRVYYMTERIGLLGENIDDALSRLIEGRKPLREWDVDLTMPGGRE